MIQDIFVLSHFIYSFCMKKLFTKLSDKQITELQEGREVLSIPSDIDFVYEQQVPNTGIALLDGEIEITKKSKTLENITSGNLFGIHHLIHQEPVAFGCKVKKNSKIILIGKSEILESLKDSKSQLFKLLKDYRKNETT